MNDILEAILKETYSISQLKHRLRILKTYFLENIFGGEENTESFTSSDLAWLKSLPTTTFQKLNKDNIYQVFESMESETSKLQTLVIYLTFEPDDSSLAQIGSYVRANLGSQLMLDTKLDPNLIAGCSLVWKGVYKDYSLRSKIEEKKEEMMQSFKKFLR